jgi:hypothetical protein
MQNELLLVRYWLYCIIRNLFLAVEYYAMLANTTLNQNGRDEPVKWLEHLLPIWTATDLIPYLEIGCSEIFH